ncbi:MAG: SprB repeat-containing protein, partial [Bacteroidetes bacterium]|nr:SprB repeat-containing protein [Bacteroidota bacterium]
MKKYLLIALTAFFYTLKICSQSTNCNTATNLTLNNGTICLNGTTAGAITDNVLYGGCNTVPVNLIWYTYVTNGAANNFTITPGTLTNAEIVIYLGGCPSSPSGTLQSCVVATGSNPLITNWGMPAGVQVWIGIASNAGVSGSFQFCVKSLPPVPGPGNTCAQAKQICTTPFAQATMGPNTSGQTPACFLNPTQNDIFLKFTITQAGLLAWTATPNNPAIEYDWALWDITNGCPGTLACCNYNFANGSSLGFGMQAQAGTVACNYNAIGTPPKEFCGPMNVTCGKTYAIQISNYTTGSTAGFSLSFLNSTAMVTSNAAFSVNAPTLVCGPSLNAVINNASTGACGEVWNYGDGSPTYTGTAPPSHNYTTPGTYAITANIGGACPSSATQFVQLLAPLAATAIPTPINCFGNCTGSATVSPITGGDGIYTYLWSTGSTSTSINSLCAGIYSITVSNAKCNSSVTQT